MGVWNGWESRAVCPGRSDQATYRFNFLKEQIDAQPGGIQRGSANHIESSGSQSFVDFRGMAVDGGGYDQNWARRLSHDLAGGSDAIHHWHNHVHQEEVRAIFGAKVDCFQAVISDPRDLVASGGNQRAANGFNSDCQIVDNCNAHWGAKLQAVWCVGKLDPSFCEQFHYFRADFR